MPFVFVCEIKLVEGSACRMLETCGNDSCNHWCTCDDKATVSPWLCTGHVYAPSYVGLRSDAILGLCA